VDALIVGRKTVGNPPPILTRASVAPERWQEGCVLIRINRLTKRYSRHTVLSEVDLYAERGGIHGLIGVSGAGKSTLLRCINGLERYDSGSLRVDGIEVAGLRQADLRAFRKTIGMIFQDFALLERKTVAENVALPMECWGALKKARRLKAEELLDLVGILDKKDAYPRELSGGQKQRVAIARALTLEPKVLLCDEATSALDPKTTRSVLGLLDDINKKLGITILLVTHEMNVVKAVCDRMSIMRDGRVVASDSVENIFSDEPEALRSLIGAQTVEAPESRSAVDITLLNGDMESPVLSALARDLGVDFSLLSARVDVCRGRRVAHVHIAVQADRREQVIAYLNAKGVRARAPAVMNEREDPE
jgi:D-methionine transport system ATP-binding protein